MSASRQPPRQALAGVKVVELTHLIAGPYCGMLLAAEGAEVIKVEPPGGELARHRAPHRTGDGHAVSSHYAACNRGKKSLVLDLKNDAGRAVLRRLLGQADIFLTNLRGGALQRLGLHPSTLAHEFPQLVIACISGYGLEDAGDYEDRPGLAMVAEALSGAMSFTRDREGRPVWCGFALGDLTAAMTAHSSILLALRTRERHGEGQVLDIALAECTLPMVAVNLARVQMADAQIAAAAGSSNFQGVPMGPMPTRDGHVTLAVNDDRFWRNLCQAMERPELATDPRYATYVERARHRAEVVALTEAFTRSCTRAQLMDKLVAADVPAAPLLSMQEVLAFGYFQGRQALRTVEDGVGGTLLLPADATRQEDLTAVSRVPRLGEHRDEILGTQLGLSAGEIAALASSGAFETA